MSKKKPTTLDQSGNPAHGDTAQEVTPGATSHTAQREGDTPPAAVTAAYPLPDQTAGLGDGKMLTLRAASGFVQVGNATAKIKRRLTIPLLKLDVDSPEALSTGRLSQTIYGRVVEAIHEGRAVQNAKYPTPARLMTIEAIDGTQCKIVVNAVIQRELESPEGYPNETYVGCWFRITKFRRAEGKNYNTFEVIEIEAPTVTASQQALPAPA